MFNIFDPKGRKRDFRSRIGASRPRLYRTAYAWCHNADLADDIVQQTACIALQKYDQLNDLAALNSWLHKIMARCLADHWRSPHCKKMEAEVDPVDYNSAELVAGERQTVVRVRNAVANLPLGQRQALTLVDLEGYSYADVAIILEIPVGTVMSRISRARASLHRQLIAFKRANSEATSQLRRVK